MALLHKLLIANRGEIALRIIRSAKKLGILTVAIYTESEREAHFVRMSDESVALGKDDLETTFLDIGRMVGIALSTGCDSVHPGYGFLSENPEFALACTRNGLIFVGPDPEVLRLMGNKMAAKELAAGLDIPVAQSHRIELQSLQVLEDISYPVMIKACFGGGGKGMKIVGNSRELKREVEAASRMARNYFGNGSLFAEEYISGARHVEVQLLGDKTGNIVHLHERECSIQRNHQKIVEEAPAMFLTAELRNILFSEALKYGKALSYTGAGTVEFLIDENGKHFFMEMNPRIQVEHGITEQITGIDLVAEQLKIASGWPLSFSQREINISGHAVEARIYAEDPANDFLPSATAVEYVNLPERTDLRTESDPGCLTQSGNQFDPLCYKLIAWGKDRNSAIALLTESIRELNILGPATNAKYLEGILMHRNFLQNKITVEFCKNNHQELIHQASEPYTTVHLPYLIGFSLAKKYKKASSEGFKDPWKHLGRWRTLPELIQLDINGKAYHIVLLESNPGSLTFKWNGDTYSLSVGRKSENFLEIIIDHQPMILHYLEIANQKLNTSLENIRYQIAFPGSLANYPETSAVTDANAVPGTSVINSPLHGKILKIHIRENQRIKKGDILLIIESMKSENQILSHRNAKVKKIAVHVGSQVTDHTPLIFLED